MLQANYQKVLAAAAICYIACSYYGAQVSLCESAGNSVQPKLSCPQAGSPSAKPLSDNGRESYVLFFSPKSRRDVKISYGANGWTDQKLEELASAGFEPSKPTVMYSHGYMQSGRSQWALALRRRYDSMFKKNTPNHEPNFNLFFFDWSSYSQKQYALSVQAVPQLALVLAEFLQKLEANQRYNLDKVHLVPYALSAHIAGAAGRQLKGKLGRITALDPAGVCFAPGSPNRLSSGDAKLVVARHYDQTKMGSPAALGGVDVFVNGGKDQPVGVADLNATRVEPGLLLEIDETFNNKFGANHARAFEHEAQLPGEDDCQELAYACADYATFLAGQCADCGPKADKCLYLSNFNNLRSARQSVSYPPNTRMYIKTNHGPHFYCLHHYQVLVQLRPDAGQPTKALMNSGTLTFDFGAHLQVRPKNQTSDGRYSALETRADKLRKNQVQKLTILPDGYRSKQVDEDAIKELMRSLATIEINYMSNSDANLRARGSFKLCSNEARQMVKC